MTRLSGIVRPLALGWLVLLADFPGKASAELLYFAKGGSVQAPASIKGDVVSVKTPAGPYEFRRSDFRSIVAGHWPEQEWSDRRKSALAGDAAARFSAAWWALENGLTPEAESMLRSTLAADPNHQPAGRMVAILDRLATPCPDPDLEPLRNALGEQTEVARGPHVVLLHQGDEAEARERIDVLERVVTTYYLFFTAQGVDLRLPTRRMGSVYFASQDDYRRYLRTEHAGAFKTTRGYYHPTLGAVLAYDCRSGGPEKTDHDLIEARGAELHRLTEAVSHMPPRSRMKISFPTEPTRTLSRPEATELVQRLERDLTRQRMLWELNRRAIDLGTASHEMVHQLVATSGLLSRHDDFPIWLHEGLAAQFEVFRGGRWAGLGRAHDLRLPDWRSIKPRPRLIPLVRDEGFGRGYQRDLYAASWGLVYFLRKEHPHEFQTFLDLLRTHGTDTEFRGDRPLDTFRSAFSPSMEELEPAWYRFMDAVKTPLETDEPQPKSIRTHAPSQRN